MIKISLKQAKEVIDLFGPCTSVYECMTPEEVVDDAENFYSSNVQDWVESLSYIDIHSAENMFEPNGPRNKIEEGTQRNHILYYKKIEQKVKESIKMIIP